MEVLVSPTCIDSCENLGKRRKEKTVRQKKRREGVQHAELHHIPLKVHLPTIPQVLLN